MFSSRISKIEVDGVEYFAVPHKYDPNDFCASSTGLTCAFIDEANKTNCSNNMCSGIVFLTKQNFITHRLTS